MFNAMTAIQPASAPASSLDLTSVSVTMVSGGSGDPCETADFMKLRATWAAVGTGTVKIEHKIGLGGTYSLVASGVASSPSSYDEVWVGYVFNSASPRQTFFYRITNEDDPADVVEGSIGRGVDTCF